MLCVGSPRYHIPQNDSHTLAERTRHFNCLALASVGEGPRPDFHFGEVSCATAHETAFRLLHAADTKLTEQLRAACAKRDSTRR